MLRSINWISVFIIVLFLMPLAAGALKPLTDSRIAAAFRTGLGAAAFILSAVLAVLVTEAVFNTGVDAGIGAMLRQLPILREAAAGEDILAYLVVLLLLLIIINGLLHLLMLPLMKKLVIPLSLTLGRYLGRMRRVPYRLVSALWQLPRSVWLVLLISLIFNMYLTLSGNGPLRSYISDSGAYRLIDAGAVGPIVDSQAARAIPTFIDSAVNRTVESLSPEGRKLLIRVYINGSTVEEAVSSTPDIDNTAIDLVDTEADDYKKAEILYHWICAQISYDRDKADAITVDAFSVTSGAATAYTQRTGVCFDKACLFVSMCRAVDVPVRLMTGEGFNGTAWEDHSWNQIYDAKTDRWVNVDTTFGANGGDYFDRTGFWNDHRGAEIQGEW
jgi:hypothetical protein